MRFSRLHLFCPLVVLLLSTCVLAQDAGGVIYVNGTSGSDINTGLSWGCPVYTINKGIARAQEYNRHEIWVTGGKYVECVVILNYYIQMYGGFTGGEVERDERDYKANVTTIVGKCDDERQQYCPCVTINNASNSIVDGFTITGGGGVMPTGMRYGGGFYIVQSQNVWLWNDIVTLNTARHGGGVYAIQSGLWIKDCDISSNTGLDEGGGIFMDASSFMPKIEYTSVTNNMSYGRGGNILLDHDCTGWIINDTITKGVSAFGGGIACYHNSGPFIHENTISDNFAFKGGGMYLDGSSPNTLLNNITSNGAGDADAGGGIYCNNASSPRIERNRIKSNYGGAEAKTKGGGVYVNGSSPVVVNNIIDYNTVLTAGGGMAVENSSNVTVCSNTFAWNEAWEVISSSWPEEYLGSGGAIYIGSSSAVTAENNIFYQDLARNGVEVFVDWGCTYKADYNDYFTSPPYAVGFVIYCANAPMLYCDYGPHDWLADPMFLDSDYHISWDSPMIDRGDNDAPAIGGADFVDGDPRKLDGNGDGSVIIDIGADEYWRAIQDMGEAKGAADGTPVLFDPAIVTVAWCDFYYVENLDRTMGIRIEQPASSVSLGDAVRAYGRIRTNSDYERYIAPTKITVIGGPEYLKPVAMNNKATGGGRFPRTGTNYQRGVYSWNNGRKVPPWAEAPGLNNIGLFAITWGKVTWVNSDSEHPENEYFYIDDGSLRVDGTLHHMDPDGYQPNFGIRCVLNGQSIPPYVREGCYVTVTGISSCVVLDADPVRLFRVRCPGDILPWMMPSM